MYPSITAKVAMSRSTTDEVFTPPTANVAMNDDRFMKSQLELTR